MNKILLVGFALFGMAVPAWAEATYLDNGKVHVIDYPFKSAGRVYVGFCDHDGRGRQPPAPPKITTVKVKAGAVLSDDFEFCSESKGYIYDVISDHGVSVGGYGFPRAVVYGGTLLGVFNVSANGCIDVYGGTFTGPNYSFLAAAEGCPNRVFGGTFNHRLYVGNTHLYGGNFPHVAAHSWPGPVYFHGRNFSLSEPIIWDGRNGNTLTGEWGDGTLFSTVVTYGLDQSDIVRFVNVDETLSVALDQDGTWLTGGMAPWFPDGSGARSGDVIHSKTSWMKTTVEGPKTITFSWMTSSEIGDKLRFSIDGVVKATRSGATRWQRKTFRIPSGSHEVKWTFKRNARGSAGRNAGYVDRMSIWD